MTESGSGAALLLGTVQFGLAYGVAGRGEVVPEAEVRSVLELATSSGITALDTAPAYGDIEARLATLCEGLPLSIVSKIAPIPPDTSDAGAAVRASVGLSRTRLGDRLTTLLFHRADDLLRPDADMIWRSALDEAGSVRVGVSVYDPATLVTLRSRYGVSVAQVPANPLDQRLRRPGVADALAGVEIHARSVFLQGLLLLPPSDVRARVPAAVEAHATWTAWCESRGLSPLLAALAVTRAFPGVSACVVGVDQRSQLQQIVAAAQHAGPLDAPMLQCDDLDVIDPRRWTAA
ncbi:MAG: aldo/keto reductase [Vicinamibacterales bacterium]